MGVYLRGGLPFLFGQRGEDMLRQSADSGRPGSSAQEKPDPEIAETFASRSLS
jgi:hypothetical protein